MANAVLQLAADPAMRERLGAAGFMHAQEHRSFTLNQALALAAVLTLLVAGADEIHQLWLPGRQAGWTDWIADATGMALGLAGLWWVNRHTAITSHLSG